MTVRQVIRIQVATTLALAWSLAAFAAVQPPGDHYLCYKTKLDAASPKFVKTQKTLVDQFRSATYNVTRIASVCNPATKDDGTCVTTGCAFGLTNCCSRNGTRACTVDGDCTFAPTHPSVHQVEHRISAVTGTARFASVRVTILDQLGFRDLQVKGPMSLFEPASKIIGNGVPGPVNRAGVDRYECYKVAKPKGASLASFIAVVSPRITDEFGGPIAYDLSKPTKLCAPVNKNNEDPGADTHPGHLVCYKAKRQSTEPAFTPLTVSTNTSNFGAFVLDAVKPTELCLPAFKNPSCGDNAVDQANEQCDGTDDSACFAPGFCQPDCKCAPPECGDGVLTPSNGEQCDPPCSQAQCSGGQICNGLCQCVPDAGACSGTCGLPPPTTFTFTAGVGTGQCGTLTTGTGTTPLACGGLFFGGGNDDVPLPVVIPDKLGNPTKVACCRGTTLNLQKTTLGDTGSLRTCSARGCFFGAPLPVPNPILPAASTCILNIISRDTGGTASCTTGDASILMPLDSDITLAGDIMPKRCNAATTGGMAGFSCTTSANCPGGACVNDPAIQPCPVCNPTTNLCNGGPSEGAPCSPDSSNLGKCSTTTTQFCRVGVPGDCPGTETCNSTTAYPTSHDCTAGGTPLFPPPLPIQLDLTTGMETSTAFSTGAGSGKSSVFCPSCRKSGGGAFELPGEACLCDHGGACGMPCSTTDFPSCEQQHNGAFQFPDATGLEVDGLAAGTISDRLQHNAKLVSLFCIPPTGNVLVDPNADLPGPGALTLQGVAQLLP